MSAVLRKIEIVLAVMLVALIGANVYLYVSRDKKAPQISFSVTPVYYEGDDESVLLDGVAASDNKDGDVTSSVIVDHIVESDDGNSVIVYYAAKDSSNNVSKASRKVDVHRVAVPAPEPEEQSPEEE